MLNRIVDSLPMVGGGSAALTTSLPFLSLFPTKEAIIGAIIITFIGATVGYFVKLFYDWILKK